MSQPFILVWGFSGRDQRYASSHRCPWISESGVQQGRVWQELAGSLAQPRSQVWSLAPSCSFCIFSPLMVPWNQAKLVTSDGIRCCSFWCGFITSLTSCQVKVLVKPRKIKNRDLGGHTCYSTSGLTFSSLEVPELLPYPTSHHPSSPTDQTTCLNHRLQKICLQLVSFFLPNFNLLARVKTEVWHSRSGFLQRRGQYTFHRWWYPYTRISSGR